MNKSKCNKAKSFVGENIEKAKTNGLRCTIYSVNGDQYTGEWKNNKKHGQGQYVWKDTQLIYEGQWKFGKRSGFGVLSVVGPDGKHTKIYSGSWKNDKRHGFGENWYSDDEFYEGECQVMEGVWVDDIARCAQIIDLGGRSEPTSTTYPIPELKLEDSRNVLRNAYDRSLDVLTSKYGQKLCKQP
ncbi:MORN repeat-containing protein 3 [Sparganum proliferum]